MRQKRILLLSTVLSLLFHVVLIVGSAFLWVPGVSGVTQSPYKMFDVRSVKMDTPRPSQELLRESYVEQLKFEKPTEDTGELLNTRMLSPGEIRQPEDFESTPADETPLSETFAPEQVPLDSPKEDIRIERRETVPLKQAPDADYVQAVPPPRYSGGRKEMEIPEEFFDEMPAFTPEKVLKESAVISPAQDAGRRAPRELRTVRAFKPDPAHEQLDEFLTVNIQTYTDPRDQQKYFQLSVYPAYKREDLEVMPKEIIFLVDASLSIRKRRLHEFKEGVKFALERLNPSDLFNIYVFKNRVIPYAEESVPVGPGEISGALHFLDTLQASRTTDLYKAFYETIQMPAKIHPSYIVLLSDGKPTAGIQSNANLIRQITRFNNQERPIFTFSGGGRVDRFLLDFMAYSNRGWSEYTRDESDIDQRLSELYQKISNPVLVDVHYQITPIDARETYPKNLPDFYRDTVFTLYGKFDEEQKFSIRVLGEIGNTTKEFIFTHDLSRAGQGTMDIARYWAFNKVYHLISEMTLGQPNPYDKQLIRQLIEKFDLHIPYDFDKILG